MLPFTKYQGTGNDFVLVDQRDRTYLTRGDTARIARLCDRRFGIGADGLILLERHPDHDFEMVYFNADGRASSLCGNGGRCVTHFAHALGLGGPDYRFLASDGVHTARVRADNWVELHMHDVTDIDADADRSVLDTGSPHYVTFVEDLDDIDVVENGQLIRYSAPYKAAGINVNFVEPTDDEGLRILTYERGVEAETLSCGTGVTAAALAYALRSATKKAEFQIPVQARGGQLIVRFRPRPGGGFTDIWLCGPATPVFTGEIALTE